MTAVLPPHSPSTLPLNDIQSAAELKLKQLSLKRHAVADIQQRMISLNYKQLNSAIEQTVYNTLTQKQLHDARLRANDELETKLRKRQEELLSQEKIVITVLPDTIAAKQHSALQILHNLPVDDNTQLPLSPALRTKILTSQHQQNEDMQLRIQQRKAMMSDLSHELVVKVNDKDQKLESKRQHMQIAMQKAKNPSLESELKLKATAASQRTQNHLQVKQQIHERKSSQQLQMLLNELTTDMPMSKLRSKMELDQQTADEQLQEKLRSGKTSRSRRPSVMQQQEING